MNRGLHYGDGLFETIAVIHGKACLWDLHIERLMNGCRRLGLEVPDQQLLAAQVRQLAETHVHHAHHTKAIIKIIITAASPPHGRRGYLRETNKTDCILQRYPWPEHQTTDTSAFDFRVRICDLRLSQQPALAGIKHLNRLENVLARSEWDDPSISEGLLFDQSGYLIEGISSNVFLNIQGGLYTPELDQAGVDGVVRQLILTEARQMGCPVSVTGIDMTMLKEADALYMTNSIAGIRHVSEVIGLTRYSGSDADHAVINKAKESIHSPDSDSQHDA